MRLTPDEIRLIVVITLALLIGATVKHYRHRSRAEPLPPAANATPTPRV
jgi:hypothetical protein